MIRSKSTGNLTVVPSCWWTRKPRQMVKPQIDGCGEAGNQTHTAVPKGNRQSEQNHNVKHKKMVISLSNTHHNYSTAAEMNQGKTATERRISQICPFNDCVIYPLICYIHCNLVWCIWHCTKMAPKNHKKYFSGRITISNIPHPDRNPCTPSYLRVNTGEPNYGSVAFHVITPCSVNTCNPHRSLHAGWIPAEALAPMSHRSAAQHTVTEQSLPRFQGHEKDSAVQPTCNQKTPVASLTRDINGWQEENK